MSNKDSLKQNFVDCAFYGYLDGFKAILNSGRSFPEPTWLEALKSAALGGGSVMVRFILNQYVLQRRDLAVDADWLRSLEERQPAIGHDIDQCDRYIRAERLRAKLKADYSIDAPEVPRPEFIDHDAKTYPFGEEGAVPPAKEAPQGSAVFASSDQFGRGAPTRPGGRAPDAQQVEQWLAQAGKRGS